MPVRMIHTQNLNRYLSDLKPIKPDVFRSFTVDNDAGEHTEVTITQYKYPIKNTKTTPLSVHYREPRSTNKYGIPNITLEFGAKDNKIAIKVIKSSKKLKKVSRALQDATIEQTDDPSCILLHFKHVISGIKGFSITVRESKDQWGYPIEPLSFQFKKNITVLKSQDKGYRVDQKIAVSIPSIFTYNSYHPSKSVLGLMERYLSKSITKEEPPVANPNQSHILVPSERLSISRQTSLQSSTYTSHHFSAGCRHIMLLHSSEATTVPSQSIGDFDGWLLEFPCEIDSTEPVISYRSVSVSVITTRDNVKKVEKIWW